MIWRKKKLGTILGAAALAVVLAVLVYLIVVPRRVKVEVATVVVGPFEETIRADGVLRSKERYTVPAFADGDIKRVPLKVGDAVKKGDVITELFWDVKYEPLRAPIAGVVSKVHRDSAGPIRRGEPIVEIIDPSRLEVVAELLTTDAVRLKKGADVSIENWSGGEPLAAKVTRVSKAGFTKASALGVEEERTEVTADLQDPSASVLENVGSTFHVDVTFEVDEIANAVKVPVGSLFRDGSAWAVYLAEDGRARKTRVEVGKLGQREAWIRSGVSAGQVVLVYPGDLVTDGARIQPEPAASR